jgi:ABC-type transport system involved in cytochrome c biogenesis ATPase subunit
MSQQILALKLSSVEARNLKNYSVTIPLGITHLMGPAGAGKTTLLRDIIYAESNNRIKLLANPAVSNIESGYSGQLEGLPLTLFFSGDTPQSQAGTIGSSLGIDRDIFNLFRDSLSVECFKCHSIFRQTTMMERALALAQESSITGAKSIRIFLAQNIPIDKLDDSTKKWRSRGFEKVLTIRAKDSETQEILIEVDSLNFNECSAQRLAESTTLAEELGTDLCLTHKNPTEANLKLLHTQRLASKHKCPKCFHPIAPSNFTQISQENLTAKATLKEEAWVTLQGRLLDESLPISLLNTLNSPLTDLLRMKPLVERLPLRTTELLTQLASLGFSELNLVTPLKNLDFISRQRLGLLRLFSLAPEKTLLILDDPLFELQERYHDVIKSLLVNHTKKGGSAIISSHLSCLTKLCTHKIELPLPQHKTDTVREDELKSARNNLSGNLSSSNLVEVVINYESLYSSPNKTVCQALKIQEDIASLFSATNESRALGLTKSSFIIPKIAEPSHNLITFNKRSINQIYAMPLWEVHAHFFDILKITKKIKIALSLGLGHLPLLRLFSELSLCERILMIFAGLLANKPKSKKIRVIGLISLLTPEIQNTTRALINNQLDHSNVVEFE